MKMSCSVAALGKKEPVISPEFLKAIALEHKVSDAELAVVSLAMEGLSTAAIAQQLGISNDAVRKRLSEVYQKFQISGRGPVKLTKLQQLLISRYQAQSQPDWVDVVAPSTTDQAHYDWGEAPEVSVFYGRQAELETLKSWILGESSKESQGQRCRLIGLLGMAGIGKTALTVKLAQDLQTEFPVLIWRSLRPAPPLETLLKTWLDCLPGSDQAPVSPSLEFLDLQISHLIEVLRQSRCLLILDGVESILQSGDLAGIYRAGYEDYGKLFKRLGQEPHQSCLLLTSQEKPTELSLLEGEQSPVRSLTLKGLNPEAAQHLLTEKGLSGNPQKWDDLIRGYRGNPLMLKMVATTIKEVFDGDVMLFLKTTLFTHDISDYIEEILERLSDLEEQILYQITLKQQPISVSELLEQLAGTSPQDLIRALQSLKQRSLLETTEGRFTLSPAVMEVIQATVEST